MSEIDRSVRVRALLDQWFLVVVAALLLVAVAGGAWAYQVHATDTVETEQVTTERWSETTSYEHSSVIVNESIPFEEGERVTNRPVYYTRLSEELAISYRYEYAADDGAVQVNTETSVQYRGVEGETTLWEYSEPLASGTAEGLSPSTPHTVNATLVIEDVYETIDTVERQLGSAGTIEIRIVSTSSVSGTIDGESVDHTYESVMPITVTPTTFRVLEIQTVDEAETQTRTVEQSTESGAVESAAPVLLSLLAVVALVGLGYGRHTGYVGISADERELLELHQQEQEFSEWITRGTFPSERDYEQTILVDDLEGLVDVAIDTNKRVIKDEQLGVSTVLDGDYVYVYVRPDSPAEDWLVNYADTTMEEFDSYDF
ncbi:hypothetical protein EXE46_15805 [Halorubrum sp. GN11_10-6_MGM]|uniref:DUF5305 domain-containing protein n=1 Tax=Halorubrum sp. GN11_10-6_MGM TaxID=2518112 RepID=UPI0010F644A6|nr:DUF5305 domain-containing protein [Halorubrum sp. GN11_10-6_MGM]TKX72483.1 hypothetical protein EXE46_15805 [Halorubrum sp. GN11_10-6_MGM]